MRRLVAVASMAVAGLALAAVMAHELAHIKHRHPAAALGRGGLP